MANTQWVPPSIGLIARVFKTESPHKWEVRACPLSGGKIKANSVGVIQIMREQVWAQNVAQKWNKQVWLLAQKERKTI